MQTTVRRQLCLALQALARLTAPAALAITMSAPATAEPAAEARMPHRDKGAFPQINLTDRATRGQRAVDQLGGRLPEVAAWYGKSADEFKAQLLHDRSWRLDHRGRVYIVEELARPLAATNPTATPTSLSDGAFEPLDQTFLLHSKPGAQRTLHLNFRGATLSGTAWNDIGSSLNALPFDLDGIPYTFSTVELQRIQAIWQRVAEDFAPFDVDVTTEAVAQAHISRSGTSDAVFGTTVLVTSSSGVYDCLCGGVAYLGAFDDTTDFFKPALVFYNLLGAGDEKFVAEAISHEAGHNMGLSHDGTASLGYYSGHGGGATGWAPIMGVGYYQSLTQWSKGEYSGANNIQDDLAVMQSNGVPMRADDHGNTPATATVLTGITAGGLTSYTAQGIIENAGDVDVFAFTAGAGSASFSVSPAARAPNLDVRVTLRNAAGTALRTANPAEAVDARFSTTLPTAGTYTLSVQGIGKGDPLTTGYSAYGSLGRYAVAATVATVPGAAPRAVISASSLRGTAPLTVSFAGAGSTDADGSVVAWDWSFSDGGTISGATTTRTYASPGAYTTSLRVTDNAGLTGSDSVTVTVDAPVAIPTMRVTDIGMALAVSAYGVAQASAAVTVVDGNGLPVAGAGVVGHWSDLVARTSTVATNDSGIARFTSPNTRTATGSFRFAVTGVSRSGYTYAPLTNTETSDSIAR
jgi:hypothetical protein